MHNCKNMQIVYEKPLFVNEKKSIRQNSEIKYKKIDFIICFKEIKRKIGFTNLVFLLQINFSLALLYIF